VTSTTTEDLTTDAERLAVALKAMAEMKISLSKLEASNAELEASNAEVVAELEASNAELEASNAELEASNAELEASNAEVVAELEASNAELEASNAELEASNAEVVAELEASNAELEASNAELEASNAELKAIKAKEANWGGDFDVLNSQKTQVMKEFLHEPVKYANIEAASSTVVLQQKILEVARSAGHSKHFAVVNSTGNGKTYACIQQGKSDQLHSLYVLCAAHGTGYQPCKEVVAIAKAIVDRATLDEKNVVALGFVRHLQKKMQHVHDCGDDHFRMQFDPDGNYTGLNSFLDDDALKSICNAEVVARFSPASKRILAKMGETGGAVEDLEEKRPKYVTFAAECVTDVVQTTASASFREADDHSIDGTPMVIVFDEADGLLRGLNVDDEGCPLRCIQRACDACGIVSIYLSTTSRIQRIQSMEISTRRPLRTFIKPFVDVVQHDLYPDHLFQLGRPMWHHNWKNQCVEDYSALVNFAKSKLIGNGIDDKKTAMCALFALRFGMRPTSSATETFVSNHMAILTDLESVTEMDVQSSRFTGTCIWLSEPILAEASCYLTSYNKSFKRIDVLRTIKQELESGLIAPLVGDKGEVLAAALFGFTMDALRQKNNKDNSYNPNQLSSSMSACVSLCEFLSSIGLPLEPELVTALDGYVVNFTHFQRLDKEMGIEDCAQAARRCLAFYMLAGSDAVDIIIIGFKVTEGRFSFVPIRCQVKNLKIKITNPAANILLHEMIKCQLFLKNSCVQIGIVIAIGSGGADHKRSSFFSTSSTTITRSQAVVKEAASPPLYYGFLVGIETVDSKRFFPLLTDDELIAVKNIAESHTFAIEMSAHVKDGFRNDRETVSCLL